MKPNKTNRKIDRGFYKPKSYRFSIETQEILKNLAIEFGSQEKALKVLINSFKKHGK